MNVKLNVSASDVILLMISPDDVFSNATDGKLSTFLYVRNPNFLVSELSTLRKWVLSVTWSIILLTSTFSTLQHLIAVDNNKNRHASIEFLKEKDYDFGYATCWNSTVITYLTNGKIKVGNLTRNKENKNLITEKYDFTKWLTPKDWYTDDFNNKPIFLLVQQSEYDLSKDYEVYKNGTLVYEDKFFKIYEYKNHNAFKEAF